MAILRREDKRSKPIISDYYCADCTAALDVQDKCYLMGWCAVEDTPKIVKDSREYKMGLEDRLREAHQDEAIDASYVGDQNECTCNPMGWNVEKDCPLHDE